MRTCVEGDEYVDSDEDVGFGFWDVWTLIDVFGVAPRLLIASDPSVVTYTQAFLNLPLSPRYIPTTLIDETPEDSMKEYHSTIAVTSI